MKIQFLGAALTVTGSRTLIQHGTKKVLIDCGLFQGFKHLRLRNREPLPIAPSEIDAVVLTHAHLDHSGYIPLLVKEGFKGPVYSTHGTRDLCGILLPDSGYLQEEETRYANKRGFSKHKPALPLYTEKDAIASLASFKTVDWYHPVDLGGGLSFEFHRAGHLFGASSLLVSNGHARLAFSGDVGRKSDPMVCDPDFRGDPDYVIVESTYGNRAHETIPPMDELKDVVVRTISRGGVLLIPSFAVGRAQLVLYYLHELKKRGELPDVPIYLNSPMAKNTNEVLIKAIGESKLGREQMRAVCETAKVISSPEESIELNEKREPMIIIAASGMATGGRVLHHLKAFAGDEKNTVLFVGFQAGGTRGEAMLKGAKEIKIHGEYWPVRAEIAHINSMSAHADQGELIQWLRALPKPPKKIFVNHGEPEAADAFRRKIEEALHVEAVTPEHLQSFSL